MKQKKSDVMLNYNRVSTFRKSSLIIGISGIAFGFMLASCAPNTDQLPPPTLFAAEVDEHDYSYDKATSLRSGQGAYRDYAEALSLLQTLASRNEDTRAMNDLGVMYAKGQGVTQNFRTATKWFFKAAERGNSSARYNLAVMELHGITGEPDLNKAVYLLYESAQQGNGRAQVLLADIWKSNQHSNLNQESRRLFHRASESGNLNAWMHMGNLPEGRWLNSLKQEPMSADRIVSNMLVDAYHPHNSNLHVKERAKREVYSLREKSEAGDRVARYNLGKRYINGDGVPRDEAEAARLFTLSAQSGYAPAQYSLGRMYISGEGVYPNIIAAYHWFSMASQPGSGETANHAREELSHLENKMSPSLLRTAQKWSKTIENN